MAYSIIIRFDMEQEERHSLNARIKNFAEDLYRELRKNELGEIDLDAVDRGGFVEQIHVTAVHSKKALMAMKMLTALLASQNLLAATECLRVSRP